MGDWHLYNRIEMSVTTTITIPSPIITSGDFTVEILNSAGSRVFASAETNDPFDVSLDPDCYTMRTTNNGFTNLWCFCITDCECIPYVSSVITEPSTAGVRYVEATFDISGWTFCPFLIKISGTSGNVYPINSLSDLVHISGTLYKFVAYVGNVSTAQLTVFLGLSSGSICVIENLAYTCSPALFVDPLHPHAVHIELVKIGAQWYIRFGFWSCGTSCHTFTINYRQNYAVGAPDSGSQVVTLDCSDLSPWTTDVPINPNATFFIGQGALDPSDLLYLAYFLTITDCCSTVVGPTGINNNGPDPFRPD